MSRTHLLVTLLVAVLCTGILVLFTDLEESVRRWPACGPWASETSRRQPQCR
jgi:hypothetical protein